MRLSFAATGLLLASTVLPQLAQAGMGNRTTTPVYHPEPCHGDACRADDPRSGVPCQGLLCSFSSAKALQPPVTAAQAAEAQQRAAAAPVAPIEMTDPVARAATATVKKKRVRRVATSGAPSQGAEPVADGTTAR